MTSAVFVYKMHSALAWIGSVRNPPARRTRRTPRGARTRADRWPLRSGAARAGSSRWRMPWARPGAAWMRRTEPPPRPERRRHARCGRAQCTRCGTRCWTAPPVSCCMVTTTSRRRSASSCGAAAAPCAAPTLPSRRRPRPRHRAPSLPRALVVAGVPLALSSGARISRPRSPARLCFRARRPRLRYARNKSATRVDAAGTELRRTAARDTSSPAVRPLARPAHTHRWRASLPDASGGGARGPWQEVEFERSAESPRIAREQSLACIQATAGSWLFQQCQVRSRGPLPPPVC